MTAPHQADLAPAHDDVANPLFGLAAPQRLSKEELLTLVERFGQALEAVAEGITWLDMSGRIVYVNEAAVRLLGYSAREIIGRSQHELVHARYADGTVFPVEACPIYASYMEGVAQRVANDVFWHRDGRAIPVEYVSMPVREGRKVVGAVTTFRDISDSLRLEAQTQVLAAEQGAREVAERVAEDVVRQEQRYRELSDSIPVQVWIARADGTIEHASQRLLDYLAQPATALMGSGVGTLVHEDDVTAAGERWKAALAAGVEYEAVLRLRRADGAYRWHLSRATPQRDASGTITRWHGVNVDIHDYREGSRTERTSAIPGLRTASPSPPAPARGE